MDRWLKSKVPDDANHVENSNEQDTNVVDSAASRIYQFGGDPIYPGA